MKLALVIGRVVLNTLDPAYKGARFLLALPWKPGLPEGQLPKGNSFVVYDKLGASAGDLIGYSDGGEAAAPFAEPTPCDAYNCAIIDRILHQPPETAATPEPAVAARS
ncbi:MAG: ethanolamine utilization protein EutN [Opitutales bacterium]|nr:ethanolamine utilization protein EutN [Opitutales bacterium]